VSLAWEGLGCWVGRRWLLLQEWRTGRLFFWLGGRLLERLGQTQCGSSGLSGHRCVDCSSDASWVLRWGGERVWVANLSASASSSSASLRHRQWLCVSGLFRVVFHGFCWEGAVIAGGGHMCRQVWHHRRRRREVVVVIGRWVLPGVHLADAGCESGKIDSWRGWCEGERGVLVGWVLGCRRCCRCRRRRRVVVAAVG